MADNDRSSILKPFTAPEFETGGGGGGRIRPPPLRPAMRAPPPRVAISPPLVSQGFRLPAGLASARIAAAIPLFFGANVARDSAEIETYLDTLQDDHIDRMRHKRDALSSAPWTDVNSTMVGEHRWYYPEPPDWSPLPILQRVPSYDPLAAPTYSPGRFSPSEGETWQPLGKVGRALGQGASDFDHTITVRGSHLVYGAAHGIGTSTEPKLSIRSTPVRQGTAERRRVDTKGSVVYFALLRGITATYGAASEVQDLFDALAWNVKDFSGRSAMLLERKAAFQGKKMDKGDTLGALGVKAGQYVGVLNGVLDGRYQIDLGGFAFDYAVGQMGDIEHALSAKAMQRGANALGYNRPVGVEAFINPVKRKENVRQQTFSAYLRKEYASAWHDRFYWSRRALARH